MRAFTTYCIWLCIVFLMSCQYAKIIGWRIFKLKIVVFLTYKNLLWSKITLWHNWYGYLLKFMSNIGGLSWLLHINGTSNCFIGSLKGKTNIIYKLPWLLFLFKNIIVNQQADIDFYYWCHIDIELLNISIFWLQTTTA